MGVRATLPNFKSLTFDGENSRDYGVYITGQAVFNAPERNVEMVEIPGRNGAYALDKGNFNNIEVTYPAGIFADSLTDFAEAVSDFRNFLCSRTGYVRLTDDYNPDEYRLAVYKSGLEVTPTQLIAGEFNITFECKPQRYLTSGEDLIEVGAWGETEEVSGSIATFNVTDEDTKVKSLKVDINPIQDLHGYDSPWVGGAGKNKCDTTKLSVVGTSNIHGYYTDGFTLEANKAYTLSVSSACAQLAFQDYSSGSNLAVSYGKTWVTYTPTVDTLVKFDAFYNASYPAPSGGLDSVNVQLEQNASQTSFEPFANLCPISGWDSVGVVECGVNVWDGTGTDGYNLNSVGGTYASQTSFVTNIIKVVPNAQYYLNPTNWRQYVNFFSDKDGNDFVGQVSAVSNVITVPQNGNYAQFGGILAEKATASINYPSTDHDYHAYNGHTYTATLPSTTYGGVLDLVSGDGSNKYDLLDLSLLSWDAGDAPRYRSRQTSYNEGNGWNGSYTNIKSNCFVAENPNLAFADRSDYSIANIKQNYYNIDIKMPSGMFADATAFKTWLGNIDGNNTHAVMLIEKATPTSFSVTPTTVSTLLGINNVWADSGDVTVTYVNTMSSIPLKIYSGSTNNMTLLPSPVSISTTNEQIWSEDTGRAQSGSNQAEMIGTSIAEKVTYAIKWGVLTGAELSTIKANMPKGFFYFGIGKTKPTSPSKFYRSEIAYDILQASDEVMYKDVSVSVIQK